MERTGIESVTSGLQSRDPGRDGRRRSASIGITMRVCTVCLRCGPHCSRRPSGTFRRRVGVVAIRSTQACSAFSSLRGVRYLLPCRREEPVSRLYIGLVLFVIQKCVALITRPSFWLRLAGGTRILLRLSVVQDCIRYRL